MKILFKQDNGRGPLFEEGIEFCYLKAITVDSDINRISHKLHHHTGFEAHIVLSGSQSYMINGIEYEVREGQMLFIPPLIAHKACEYSPGTEKYSISFKSIGKITGFDINEKNEILKPLNEDTLTLINKIANECLQNRPISKKIAECGVLNIVVDILRLAGYKESEEGVVNIDSDARLSMAKQYIEDNLDSLLSVGEVASYCAICSKQLERIFIDHEGVTPLKYINSLRAKRAEDLVACGEYSLKEISEMMHFSNESYFNSFFKRTVGITPGAYKKMTSK